VRDDEILAEVVDQPRHAYVVLPDMRVIERPGWFQLITPSFTQGGFNDVHAELDEADADRVIAETIDEYRRLGLQFRWILGPESKPADLADRLARAGLRRTDSFGMARSTDITPSSSIAVARVDATTLDQFTQTMSDGWRRDAAPFRAAHRAMLASNSQHMFLAMCDGEYAGAATYRFHARPTCSARSCARRFVAAASIARSSNRDLSMPPRVASRSRRHTRWPRPRRRCSLASGSAPCASSYRFAASTGRAQASCARAG